jgi:hypothetical protein
MTYEMTSPTHCGNDPNGKLLFLAFPHCGSSCDRFFEFSPAPGRLCARQQRRAELDSQLDALNDFANFTFSRGWAKNSPLANIEIVNDQARVHHDVWRDGVEGPHMDPGISCPECEE